MYLQDNHTAFTMALTRGPELLLLFTTTDTFQSDPCSIPGSGTCSEYARSSPGRGVQDQGLSHQTIEVGRGPRGPSPSGREQVPSEQEADEHVGNIIKGNSEYILLDDQLVVYDKDHGLGQERVHDRRKAAIIVKGGPARQSVIAINLWPTSCSKLQCAICHRLESVHRNAVEDNRPRGSVQFKYTIATWTPRRTPWTFWWPMSHRIGRTAQHVHT
jgi:hypothetical protein